MHTMALYLVLLMLGAVYGSDISRAEDNGYSKLVCKYLENQHSANACNHAYSYKLDNNCNLEYSFFSKDEVEKYINSATVNFDDTKYEIEQLFDGFNFTEEKKQLLDIFTGLLMTLKKTYYSLANTYNLGAICMAAYPEGYFSNNGTEIVYVVKNTINNIKTQCEKTINNTKEGFLILSHELYAETGSGNMDDEKDKINAWADKISSEYCSNITNVRFGNEMDVMHFYYNEIMKFSNTNKIDSSDENITGYSLIDDFCEEIGSIIDNNNDEKKRELYSENCKKYFKEEYIPYFDCDDCYIDSTLKEQNLGGFDVWAHTESSSKYFEYVKFPMDNATKNIHAKYLELFPEETESNWTTCIVIGGIVVLIAITIGVFITYKKCKARHLNNKINNTNVINSPFNDSDTSDI